MPACVVLFSPYADLTLSRESMTGKAAADPAFRPDAFPVRVKDYVGATDPGDGLISPVFADLHGLPPLPIQAGSNELLLDDAVRLAGRAVRFDRYGDRDVLCIAESTCPWRARPGGGQGPGRRHQPQSGLDPHRGAWPR